MSENEHLKQIVYYKMADGHCPYMNGLILWMIKPKQLLIIE